MHTNNSEAMLINCDSPSRLRSRVDKAEEVLLACLDFPKRVLTSREIGFRVATVEEVVGCTQWSVVDDVLVLLSSSDIETGYVS